jgi:hypothetical protein
MARCVSRIDFIPRRHTPILQISWTKVTILTRERSCLVLMHWRIWRSENSKLPTSLASSSKHLMLDAPVPCRQAPYRKRKIWLWTIATGLCYLPLQQSRTLDREHWTWWRSRLSGRGFRSDQRGKQRWNYPERFLPGLPCRYFPRVVPASLGVWLVQDPEESYSTHLAYLSADVEVGWWLGRYRL